MTNLADIYMPCRYTQAADAYYYEGADQRREEDILIPIPQPLRPGEKEAREAAYKRAQEQLERQFGQHTRRVIDNIFKF